MKCCDSVSLVDSDDWCFGIDLVPSLPHHKFPLSVNSKKTLTVIGECQARNLLQVKIWPNVPYMAKVPCTPEPDEAIAEASGNYIYGDSFRSRREFQAIDHVLTADVTDKSTIHCPKFQHTSIFNGAFLGDIGHGVADSSDVPCGSTDASGGHSIGMLQIPYII